jgi:endonuclease/exonuclease/phosphatase family metal-dependent hydrolase
MFSQVGDILQNYEKIFAPADEDGDYGLAIYYKKSLLLRSDGNIMIHDKTEYFPDPDVTAPKRNLQYLTLQIEDQQKVSILNFHGLWNGQGKGDTEDRLQQSEKIIAFLKTINHPFVLGGDFNLSPGTQSLKMFEDFGLRNLIKESGITSTRTSYYTKENKFADYVFVSKGVQVEDFKVLPDEVSDHAPLYVKINA